MIKKLTKTKYLYATQVALLTLDTLLLGIVIYWPISNSTNHTGFEPYYLVVPFIISALLLLILSIFCKTKNKITLLGLVVSLLGTLLLFSYKQYNIMLNYDEWLTRGMPGRFENVGTMFWVNDNATSDSPGNTVDSNLLTEGFGLTIPEPYVLLSGGKPVEIGLCSTIPESGVGVYLADQYLQDGVSFKINQEEKQNVKSNNDVQEFARVYLPQASGEFEVVGNVDLGGHIFTKYKYNSYKIITPKQSELIGEAYIYEIELDDSYLFFSHVSVPDSEIEKILSTLQANDLSCE